MFVRSLVGCGLCVTSSCVSYEPEPLDLEGWNASWVALSRGDHDAWDATLDMSVVLEMSPADLEDGVTLAEARALALHLHPDLRVARADAGVAEVQWEGAGVATDPSFGVNLLRALSATSQPWFYAASLTWSPFLGERRDAAVAQASAVSEQALARVAAAERDVLQTLEATWVDWSASTSEIATSRSRLDDLGRMLERVDALARGGSVREAEQRVFTLEHRIQSAELHDLERRTRRQEAALRGLLGLRPDAPIALVPSFEVSRRSTDGAWDELLAEHDPRLRALEAAYAQAEAQLRGAVARANWRGLSLGPAFEHEEGDDRLGATMNGTLPLWNRGAPAVATARARRDAARVRFEAGWQQRVAQLHQVAGQWDEARARKDHLDAVQRPLVEAQAEEAVRLLELGTLDLTLWLEAWRGVAGFDARWWDSVRDEARAASAWAWALDEGVGSVKEDAR